MLAVTRGGQGYKSGKKVEGLPNGVMPFCQRFEALAIAGVPNPAS
jgi:hypothetical protein